MKFPPIPQRLLIEWLNGLARVPTGGRPVVRTGVQVSVFSGRLHRIPRTYPRFWAGLRALKLPIYPFFGPAYRPGPPRFIRTAGRPLCVYSGVLPTSNEPICRFEFRPSSELTTGLTRTSMASRGPTYLQSWLVVRRIVSNRTGLGSSPRLFPRKIDAGEEQGQRVRVCAG